MPAGCKKIALLVVVALATLVDKDGPVAEGLKMGTKRKKKGKKAGRASTTDDLNNRPPLAREDLHAAVRTLAIMVDCYERREPVLHPRAAGGLDRVVETKLREAIQALQLAAKLQREQGAFRGAAVQLSYTLGEALAVAASKPIAKLKSPKFRTGGWPADWPAPTDQLEGAVGLALLEFSQSTGRAIPAATGKNATIRARKWIREAKAKTTDVQARSAAREIAADVADIGRASLADWEQLHRMSPDREQQPQAGEPTAFFGARFDIADFNQFARRLMAPFGGDAFALAAACQAGNSAVLSLAIQVVDESMPLCESSARNDQILAAMTQLVVALGGDPTNYGKMIDGHEPGAGGLYRFGDLDFGWHLLPVARGAWHVERPTTATAADVKEAARLGAEADRAAKLAEQAASKA